MPYRRPRPYAESMIQIGAKPATIDTPIEHLEACHRRIEQRLETLVRAADYLAADSVRAAQAIDQSFHFLDTSGVMHTADEEESLFPRLEPLLSRAEIEFVDSLEAQHREIETAYAELKTRAAAVSAEPVSEQVEPYRECAERLRGMYRRHIQAEDEVLMALAKRLLGGKEIEQIAEEMKSRRAAPA